MSFLIRFWPEVLVAMLIAASIGAFGVVKVQRDHARRDLSTCQANYDLAKEANDELSASVEKQNQAIDKIRLAEEARIQAVKVAEIKAEEKVKPIEQKALKIGAIQLPGDECTALREIVDTARQQ